MRIPASGGRLGRLAKFTAIPAIGLVVAACTTQSNDNPTGDDAAPQLFGETANGIGFPHEVVTTEGIASAGLYLPIFIIAVAIFVLVEGLLLFLALRFRKRSTGTDLPEQVHGNNKLEVIWTAIPMAIVFVLFVASTIVLTDVQSKSDEHAAVVDVQAFRFGWIFDYQDPGSLDAETGGYESLPVDLVTGGGREGAPTMVLPVGEPVLIRLTAADVIHSWYVPAFFFKRDAIPGRVNEFELTIEKPGVYGGQCAEFCGLAHGDMFFSVEAMEMADYDAWMAERRSGADAPADEEPSPEASPPPEGTAAPSEAAVLEIATTADKAIAFTTSSLEAQAGQLATITYFNDSKVPHNVAIFDGPDATGNEIVETETITGPGASTEATFTAPTEPGSYFFRCEIHPLQMTGTFTVSA